MKPRKNAAGVDKLSTRRSKIHALAVRGATQGERAAASAALQRTEDKLSLTSKTVARLTVPGIYWSEKVTGFALRISPGGARTFILRYRIDGRERQITVGRFDNGDWTFGAARDHARELRKQIGRGRDFAEDRKERCNAPTVGDLIKRYETDHLPTLAASTHGDQRTMLKEIGQHLGRSTLVAEVNLEKIQAMHRAIGESIGRNRVPRRARANRIVNVCSKMFSLALQARADEVVPWRDPRAGNPCKGVKRFFEEGRDYFFSKKELAAISAALDSYDGVAADAARLCMLSGCRPGEALQAQWDEFDKLPGYWLKPASRTKQRRPHKIPLNAAALALIEKRRKQRKRNDGGYVFPGDLPGKPLAALHHVWQHVREQTGIGKACRLYDLRHSFASLGAAARMGLPTIGRMLGHSSSRTTERYAHLADDVLREATELIGDAIAGARS